VLNDTLTFTVAGVMADVPQNAHFTTDFLVSYETLVDLSPEQESWLSLGAYTYLKLEEGVSAEAFEPKMAGLATRHYGETLDALGFAVTLRLQPLTDIYLHSDRGGEIGPTSDIAYVYIFSAIALFVLLIACINFMNLATTRTCARSSRRRATPQFSA
jgi:putative ABC transport system permease protein